MNANDAKKLQLANSKVKTLKSTVQNLTKEIERLLGALQTKRTKLKSLNAKLLDSEVLVSELQAQVAALKAAAPKRTRRKVPNKGKSNDSAS